VIQDGRSKFDTSLVDFLRKLKVSLPTETAEDAVPALACVNVLGRNARWIATCPDCGGAEYVWMDDPRFYCVSCRNASIDGLWRPLRVPAEREAIEAALMARPDPTTRHWLPGESVDDLLDENREHGIEVG
jgi:hypothetical protein